MNSPVIERLKGRLDVWQQISKQLKEAQEFENRITLKKGEKRCEQLSTGRG